MTGKEMRPMRNTLAIGGGVFRFGLAIAATVLLAGCLSLSGKAPEQLLSLTASETAAAGKTSGGAITDAIVVLDPEADRAIDMLRVPVRVNASSVAYLKKIAWIEKPSRQFRKLLAETLRARSSRLVVEGGDFEVTGRTLIGGRLIDMGYDAASGAVVVRFDAMKSEQGGAIATQRFESVVTGVKPDAKAVAPALNTAANDVAKQVADWVGT